MPRGRLAHVCILVRDLDQALEHWRSMLRILDPAQIAEPVVSMCPVTAGGDTFQLATLASSEGCEIQLLQPIREGPSARLLAKRGEGVHHICFAPPDVPAAVAELREVGLRFTTDELMADPALPWQRFTFIAPASANGIMIEVCCPYRAVDGRWVDDRR